MKKKLTQSLFLLLAMQGILFCTYSSAQNVGIGTAAPIEKMDVIGNIRSSNLAGTGYRVVYSDANGVLTNSFGGVSPAWLTLGNSGTNPANHFLGTIDNVNLIFKTNNTLRMWIANGGQTVVNSGTTFGGDVFAAYATGTNDAINAYNNGSGLAGYFENTGTTATSDGVAGVTLSATASGIWGVNANANGTGIIGQGNNVGGVALGTGSGGAFTGTGIGTFTLSTSATGTGIIGVGNNLGGGTTIGGGSGGAFNGSSVGVFGYVPNTNSGSFGGYFSNNAGTSYAYVGGRINPTNYKINGNGSVSTIIKYNGENRNLFCPESPEILFQDLGAGQLVNGKARINLDPIFSHSIYVDREHPMKVFIQLEGDCKGVFVSNKSASGFDVQELNGGNSNVAFSWFVSANRADDVDESGQVTSQHVGVRFPLGPGPLKTEALKTQPTKEKNTGSGKSRSEKLNFDSGK